LISEPEPETSTEAKPLPPPTIGAPEYFFEALRSCSGFRNAPTYTKKSDAVATVPFDGGRKESWPYGNFIVNSSHPSESVNVTWSLSTTIVMLKIFGSG
jgi:hypothetical protein